MQPTSFSGWVPAGRLDDLSHLTTFKHGPHQLVLVRGGDQVFALDNRCPHEGYPLAQGEAKGCLLTCAWHNWKFDVRDGSCVLGGEDVRSYPVRVRDGQVEVDLTEPDPATRVPVLLESLEAGILDRDPGRALRDTVRLLRCGHPAERLLLDLAALDARRGEYGSTHALALAADCGRLLARYRGTRAVHALAPVVDLLAETHVRSPERPLVEPHGEGAVDLAALRAAVEAEQGGRAEALLLASLRDGASWPALESWLFDLLSWHFLDFGHQLIYLVKTGELLERSGAAEEGARAILPGFLCSIVVATREDVLPYLRSYFEPLRDGTIDLEALWAAAGSGGKGDPAALRDAVLDGTRGDCLAALQEALERGMSPEAVAQALVGSSAQRLWRFDLRLDGDPDVAENWLWATHRFTFASAVRNAMRRFRDPGALRFLFQAAAFIHSGRPMDAPGSAEPPSPRSGGSAGDVITAVRARDVERATALCAGWLAEERPVDPLREALEDLCLEGPAVRPIVVTHLIKTLFAAFEEYGALTGHPDRAWPILAAVRFAASPVRESRLQQNARTALAWVDEGRMPKKLTQ